MVSKVKTTIFMYWKSFLLDAPVGVKKAGMPAPPALQKFNYVKKTLGKQGQVLHNICGVVFLTQLEKKWRTLNIFYCTFN